MPTAIYLCLCCGIPIRNKPPNHHCVRECSRGAHYDFCVRCEIAMLADFEVQTAAAEKEDDGA